MSQSIPKTTKNVENRRKLGANDVLVKFHAASLNFRDLIIPKGQYPFALRDGIIPGSDGAGEVLAVGSKVTRFTPGAKVVTLFSQTHYGGSLDHLSVQSGLGGAVDGTLRQHGIFNENGLVDMPTSLSYLEAATLPCAAVTAWNALYGLKPVKPGDVVLTQGTGGVSIFAVQFAKAAGQPMGAHAKSLTPLSAGVTHILEVGGATTMAQSLKAIKIDGVISIIGFVGGQAKEKEPGFLDCLINICTVRGLLVGSREMFEDMNRAIDASGIKPVVDEKVFGLDELKEAYQYMWDQKHFGKLAIKIE
ncbi:zinc-binding dehydrogenase [Botrytis cinerea]